MKTPTLWRQREAEQRERCGSVSFAPEAPPKRCWRKNARISSELRAVEFIRTHPGASIEDVQEAVEIASGRALELLRVYGSHTNGEHT